MKTNHLAILIGVNNYTTYELRHGLAVGSCGLQAPTEDIRGWFFLLRRLGYHEKNVQILTSPQLSAAQLFCNNAETKTADMAGWSGVVDWAVSQCEAAEGPSSLIVVFSGHGDFLARTGGACYPTDYDGSLDTVMKMAELAAALDAITGKEIGLTVIADTCRDRGDLQAPQSPGRPGGDGTWAPASHIIFSAAGPGQLAEERCIQGSWRSVFSWAACVLIGQWQPGVGGRTRGAHYIDISYSNLEARVREMVAALSRSEDPALPVLHASAGNRALAFGQRPGAAPVQTSPDPIAGPNKEITADTYGVMSDPTTTNPVGVVTTDGHGNALWRFVSSQPLSGVTQFSISFSSTSEPLPSQWPPESVLRSWTSYISADGPLSAEQTTWPAAGFFDTSQAQALETSSDTLTWYANTQHIQAGTFDTAAQAPPAPPSDTLTDHLSRAWGHFGGVHGTFFSDYVIAQGSGITAITVYWDSSVVRGIKTTYGNNEATEHGTCDSSLEQQSWSGPASQVLGPLELWIGPGPNGYPEVTGLTLKSGGLAIITAGDTAGDPDDTSGADIAGFLGRSGSDIDALGVWYS